MLYTGTKRKQKLRMVWDVHDRMRRGRTFLKSDSELLAEAVLIILILYGFLESKIDELDITFK